MDSLTAANEIAEPVGAIGSWFYFAPATAARAESLGLNAFQLYVLGRGGVLGDPTPQQVDDVFYFFKSGLIADLYAGAVALMSPVEALPEHLASADAFAAATFGGVDPHLLEAMTEATVTLAHTLPEGNWPLYDGYRNRGLPGGIHADAYRCSIWLRELRGGVHTDAVVQAALTPVEACYLRNDPRSFALHGFTDDDIPPVDDALRARRIAAEDDTSERMAQLLSPLTDQQRSALVEAALAMKPALKEPIPV